MADVNPLGSAVPSLSLPEINLDTFKGIDLPKVASMAGTSLDAGKGVDVSSLKNLGGVDLGMLSNINVSDLTKLAGIDLSMLSNINVSDLVNLPGKAAELYSSLEKQLGQQMDFVKNLAEMAQKMTGSAVQDLQNAATQQVNLAKDRVDKAMAMLSDLNSLDPTALLG